MYIENVIRQSDATKLDLKRNFGVPLMKLPTSVLVSFFRTLTDRDEKKLAAWNSEIESKWFVSSLYCYLNSREGQDRNGTRLFQDCLKDIYKRNSGEGNNESPTCRRIELLFSTDFTSSGKLETYLKKLITMNKEDFKNLDFNSLQYDLQHWNNSAFNSPRNNWVKRIVLYSDQPNDYE